MLTLLGAGQGQNSALVPSLSFDWLNTNSLTSAEGYPLTFTRASQATYWGSDGLLKTATTNEARFEYDPNTLVKRGLKIEPQVTNLLLRSEDYVNAYWLKTDITASLTTETLGIRGNTNEATKIQEGSAGTAVLSNTAVTTTASAIYACSVVIKRGNTDWICLSLLDSGGTNGGRAWFNLNTRVKGSTATVGSGASIFSDVEILQNGFARVFIRCTISTSTSMVASLFSASANSNTTRVANAFYYLNGSQIELGQFPTSYIQTTTATVTRSSDVATMATGVWYNASEGSILADFLNYSVLNPASKQFYYSLDEGVGSNKIASSLFSQVEFFVVAGGVTQSNISSSVVTPSQLTRYKLATSYKQNDFYFGINNIQIGVSSSGNTPTGITTLRIGHDNASRFSHGCFASFRYFNRKLPNATLQALTV